MTADSSHALSALDRFGASDFVDVSPSSDVGVGGDGDGDVVDRYPLSPIQLGMLVESVLSERPWVDLEQVVCQLDDGELDVELLIDAWRHVQGRHPVLRTAIVWDRATEEEPVQVVHAAAPIPVVVEDWTDRADAASASALEAWLDADRERGVDLQQAPGMRVSLLRTDSSSWVLVWTFPHALLDGRSFRRVLEEVFEAYDALVAGGTPPPVGAPPPFREHVEAVRRVDRDSARRFFTDLLDGFDEPVPVPGGRREVADEPERPGSGSRHREHELRLSADLVDRLEVRAARAGATLGSVLLTAWAVLLSRYTGRLDVVFGVTRSGRHTHAAGPELVGCLINTVAFRVRPRPDRSVDDVLREVRRLQLALRPHEQASLVDVHAWSSVPNDQPLLTTNVVFERELLGSALGAKGGPWARRQVSVREETAFPLGLAAYQDDGLLLRLEYEQGRYRPETVARMAGHLAELLDSIARSGGETELRSLEMMSAAERSELLEERHPSAGDPLGQPRSSVIDSFEAVAREHGQRDAIVAAAVGSVPVTYEALDQAANRLAHHVLDAGAGIGPVAIHLSRSPSFVVALLAVLKSGASFLPVDPAYPGPAVEHMLRDSGATLVLSEKRLAPSLPATGARVVLVDDADERAAIDARSSVPPHRGEFDRERPAYVIYTSGSTGRPKGVVVSHGALASYAEAVAARYELEATDRVLQFSSLSFDVALEEIVPTMLRGATVVLRGDEHAASMASLLEFVEEQAVTVLNLPTAFWHVLVEHLEQLAGLDGGPRPALPGSLRLLVTGGEKASRQAYAAWVGLAPSVRWLNGYGPTEATVTCTVFDPAESAYRVERGDELPIGRPLANARAYVLGGDGTWLLPEGMVGELWIGGQSVAMGYLGQPELTAERFRPDPFDTVEGARMYRTGDLARWVPGGDLAFLGRVDRQVKVRGYRIEPSQVEAALERHPAVRSAFVAARSIDDGDPQLIGWVVPSGRGPLDLGAVLDAVRAAEPAHLVPANLVRVERLARTPGGKVDLAKLPDPSAVGHRGSSSPLDPGVASIALAFREVLGGSGPIGADDSFFDLGGHSLLAVRLLGRLERDHGVRLGLAALHDGPTPRRVWAAVRSGPTAPHDGGLAPPTTDGETYLVPIQPEGSLPPLFGVHVLGTNACYYRPLAAHLGPDQPVLGLSIAEPNSDTPTAIEEIAARYATAVERVHPEGPLALAAVSMGGYVAFELAQQLRRRGRDVIALALFDASGPGGRPAVSVSHRLRLHLRQLSAVGPRYLVDRVRRLAGVARERADAARLRAHRARGRETPAELWMHEFVMANVRAADAYEAAPYPGRLVVFRAEDELFDHPSNAASGLGWAPVAAGRLDVVSVPGQHMTMLAEPAVARLATELRAALAQPAGGPGLNGSEDPGPRSRPA